MRTPLDPDEQGAWSGGRVWAGKPSSRPQRLSQAGPREVGVPLPPWGTGVPGAGPRLSCHDFSKYFHLILELRTREGRGSTSRAAAVSRVGPALWVATATGVWPVLPRAPQARRDPPECPRTQCQHRRCRGCQFPRAPQSAGLGMLRGPTSCCATSARADKVCGALDWRLTAARGGPAAREEGEAR